VREGDGDMVGKGEHPLRLAFQAREGVVVDLVVVWLENTRLGYQVREAGGVVIWKSFI
jgi:hypothetical protein